MTFLKSCRNCQIMRQNTYIMQTKGPWPNLGLYPRASSYNFYDDFCTQTFFSPFAILISQWNKYFYEIPFRFLSPWKIQKTPKYSLHCQWTPNAPSLGALKQTVCLLFRWSSMNACWGGHVAQQSCYWAAKQQNSWVIAPWWFSISLWQICITFVWPRSAFASIKLCQASWMWLDSCR